MMLIGVTRADGNKVGLGGSEHLAVIQESFFGLKPLECFFEASWIGISDADDLSLWDMFPDGVEPVSVIAPSCVPDDANTQRMGRLPEEGGGTESRQSNVF